MTNQFELPEGPIIESIFRLQKRLMKKYDVIERQNSFYVPEPPYCPDHKFVQARIKNLFWRVTEELAEAMEVECAELSDWPKHWNNIPDVRHFFEELSDALHFLVEASILAGMDPIEDLVPLFDQFLPSEYKFPIGHDMNKEMNNFAAQVILSMGLAANVLKNKPWKLTQMPTDVGKLKNKMIVVWTKFLCLWQYLGCNQKQVYLFYAKKNVVNQWRQNTNY